MVAIEATLNRQRIAEPGAQLVALAQSTMSAGVPWRQILPIPRGWLSENILAARLGEGFSFDIPFHRTGFNYNKMRLQFQTLSKT
jgi:hypothetical protein